MGVLSGFDKCKTDAQRWEWVANNQDADIMVFLDNDSTFLCDMKDEDEDSRDFDYYIGNSGGIDILLGVMGIKAEQV